MVADLVGEEYWVDKVGQAAAVFQENMVVAVQAAVVAARAAVEAARAAEVQADSNHPHY